MGQIVIEIPQRVNKNFRIVSENSAKKVLSNIERLIKKENSIEDDEILGLWSDRKESVEEIAQNLRKKLNDRSLKND